MAAVAVLDASQSWLAGDMIDALRRRAQECPDEPAFRLVADDQPDIAVNYAQLDRRARAVAARLQGMGLAGERILLAYPHGIEFIAGFFGCLYAGCTAVPTDLPHRRTLDRHAAIVSDAGVRLVLSVARAIASQRDNAAPPVPWLATDEIPDAEAEGWKAPLITPDMLAMLQYTSGSTSVPKGVMLSHANLICNARDIHRAFGMRREAAVFWLPMYHDMGLIGGVLEPVLAGASSVLLSPHAFLRQPFSWLDAISRSKATISGGPNFAFDLCTRRVSDAQRAKLDLSSWSLAFIGAEPIEPDTLDRFAARFEPCGFRREAFYPCYGLAEATLMVTGAARGAGPTVRAFDEAALGEHRVVAASDSAFTARRVVSCGTPIGDLRVVVVDPHTGASGAKERVGEVWVSGGSVAEGYWRQPGPTRRAFGAQLHQTGDCSFLRTGDLGFVCEGQLFIIGRQNDLLIVRGRNHHPQDLEATARRSHPLLDAGFGAAFSVESPAGQQLVLIHEVARAPECDFTPVLLACREAVLAEHGLLLQTIILVRSGTISRTSSGKIQRHACRAAFLAHAITPIARLDATATRSEGLAEVSPASTPAGGHAASEMAILPSAVFATVCQHALALRGTSLSRVTPDAPLTALGLDSLQRVELAATLEKTFACRLPDAEFHSARTLGELADAVQRQVTSRPKAEAQSRGIPTAQFAIDQFPEYAELRRYERMLTAVAGDNPYFRVDAGHTAGAREDELVQFGVYDYVGLARHPAVAAAAKAAIDRYGTSAGASRLVSGEKQVHRDLEGRLAEFLGTQAALVFVSGHATNVTTIGHLFGHEDLIVYDALAHNSIMQGAQLSGATRRAFAHNDWAALDTLLGEVRHRFRRVLIAIEGVYSMDGDFPDLPRFVALRNKHRTLLLVDEAHSLGTMGATGRGIGEHWGVARADVDLWMGTLSKSLASCGGYIAGAAELVEYLAYTAPGFVYSVGMSPPMAGAALAALELLRAEPGRVARLRELSGLFLSLARDRGLNVGFAAGTAVVPVIVGSSVKALRLARALLQRGINVQPILHPAVPEHSARLRFFITTNHSEAQIRATVHAISEELATLERPVSPLPSAAALRVEEHRTPGTSAHFHDHQP